MNREQFEQDVIRAEVELRYADETTLPPRTDAPVEPERPDAPGVLGFILDERSRQDEKWGEQNHRPEKWMLILGEEFGEAQKALLEGSLADYQCELVQVAAVAVAALESLRRGKWDTTP